MRIKRIPFIEDRWSREKILSAEFFIGKTTLTMKLYIYALKTLLTSPTKDNFEQLKILLKILPQYSMMSPEHILNLYNLINDINVSGIEGDIVECGVWNGGSSAIMAFSNQLHRTETSENRIFWLFDSFKGLPQPSEQDEALSKINDWKGLYKGSVENVHNICNKLNLDLDKVKIIEGWFDDTFRHVQIDKIALLHIESDLYNPIKLCLETFYDKVMLGGFIVCDDYCWKGGKKAIDEFVEKHMISIQLKNIKNVVYFQKT
ncbi:MAG: TylF/MycF family methyltransferase [Candidatus Omnitrophica bacterium]|nr:TylF/MycF family methyltransferase [Candidatus Omnitrophota bacterium]